MNKSNYYSNSSSSNNNNKLLKNKHNYKKIISIINFVTLNVFFSIELLFNNNKNKIIKPKSNKAKFHLKYKLISTKQ